MGFFVDIDGKIRVRDAPRVRKILARLETMRPPNGDCDAYLTEEKDSPGVLEIELEISGYCSHSHGEEIEKTIARLGPFAIEGARISSATESGPGSLFIGNKKQQAEAASRFALEQILENVPDLRESEAEQVLAAILSKTKRPESLIARYFKTAQSRFSIQPIQER